MKKAAVLPTLFVVVLLIVAAQQPKKGERTNNNDLSFLFSWQVLEVGERDPVGLMTVMSSSFDA
jgi:hypothetical protein